MSFQKGFPYFYNLKYTQIANASGGLQGMYVVVYI